MIESSRTNLLKLKARGDYVIRKKQREEKNPPYKYIEGEKEERGDFAAVKLTDAVALALPADRVIGSGNPPRVYIYIVACGTHFAGADNKCTT